METINNLESANHSLKIVSITEYRVSTTKKKVSKHARELNDTHERVIVL